MKRLSAFLLTASIFCSTFAFANEMCLDLCTPCAETTDNPTCLKVDSLCHCSALFDSLNAAKEAKEATQLKNREELTSALLQSCEKKVCARKVTFEDGLYSSIEQGETSLSTNDIKSLYKAAVPSNSTNSTQRVAQPAPLSGECNELCGSCPIDQTQLESDSATFENELCNKVNKSCKCFEFAKQSYLFAEQLKADSITQFESKVKRMENAAPLADTLLSKCDTVGTCILTVVLANNEMIALNIKKEEAIQLTVDSTTTEPSTVMETVPDTATYNPPTNEKDETPKQTEDYRWFYYGVTFAYEHIEYNRYYGHGLDDIANNDAMGFNLGFLLKWYFYRYGSFQLGLNVVFHHGEIGWEGGTWHTRSKAYADINSLLAEIPLEFRFGFPLGNAPISPFLSASFHIRKPIYQWLDAYVDYASEISSYSSYAWYSEDISNNGAAGSADWEFVPFVGLGLEITRHLSIEYQWTLPNFRIYDDGDEESNPYDYENGWRVKLDINF